MLATHQEGLGANINNTITCGVQGFLRTGAVQGECWCAGGGISCGREEGSRTWAKHVQFLLYHLLKIRPQRKLGLEAILRVIWSSLLFERWGN